MAPEFVARTGGSKWQSALPTGSRWQSALPTGSKWVQVQPARVGSADKRFPGKPGKPENSGASIYGSRIRR